MMNDNRYSCFTICSLEGKLAIPMQAARAEIAKKHSVQGIDNR